MLVRGTATAAGSWSTGTKRSRRTPPAVAAQASRIPITRRTRHEGRTAARHRMAGTAQLLHAAAPLARLRARARADDKAGAALHDDHAASDRSALRRGGARRARRRA